jgi:hypothetical protein
MLQFAPTVPSEEKMMERFAKIGIKAGREFDAASLDPKTRTAIEAGIKAANEQINQRKAKVTSSVGLFGTPEQMRKFPDDYLRRAVAANVGRTPETRHPAPSVWNALVSRRSGAAGRRSSLCHGPTFRPTHTRGLPDLHSLVS